LGFALPIRGVSHRGYPCPSVAGNPIEWPAGITDKPWIFITLAKTERNVELRKWTVEEEVR
jgi:hypothetical protein